jgi:putative oxidoreductase
MMKPAQSSDVCLYKEESMLKKLLALRERGLELVKKVAWLGPLLVRLTVGVVFVQTGWGKLHSLDDVTKFFAQLNIPAPHFNAILAATAEFGGGLALLLGVMTRLAAIPLITTMVVAILTAKRPELDGIGSLLGFEEFSYLAMFLWLAVAGPGVVSIDHLLARRLAAGKQAPAAQPLMPRSLAQS